MSKNNENKKKKSFFGALFKNLFGNRQELGLLEEEEVQSPFRTIINTFKDNGTAMFALVMFVGIFIFMTIGPLIMPINLSFSETSQQNIAPGRDMLKVPDELKGQVKDIAVGPTFSVGVSEDGKPYIWGKTRISGAIDLKNIPDNMENIDKIAAGFDHVLVVDKDGEIDGWGSNRQQQLAIPPELKQIRNIKDIYASYQNSMVLTEDGELFYFGNSMNNDYNMNHEYQGKLEKVQASADGIFGMTKSGEAVYLGSEQNSYSNVPQDMGKIVDIAATSTTMAALNDKGEVTVWGNVGNRPEGVVPEVVDGDKIVKLTGGRNHYVGVTENNKVVSWGADFYNQADVPSKLNDKKVEQVYSGFFQNYAVTEDNETITWGLKGYILGTDEMGRDIMGRLLNGGRMSMTIGAIAVVISTVIGVVIGGVSGYFGGTIDNILQRLSEMVAALPFLPFAMILSSLIGNKLPTKQKTFMLMVILGLLSWPGLQRLVRAQVLSVREEEYVTAARAVGIKQKDIIFRHILPNVVSVIIVNATLNFGTSMLTESTLSYLGFGVQAPQPTWGNMLYGANDSIVIQNYWWRWVFASIILGVCVICVNLIGEGLRDAIDPKSQER